MKHEKVLKYLVVCISLFLVSCGTEELENANAKLKKQVKDLETAEAQLKLKNTDLENQVADMQARLTLLLTSPVDAANQQLDGPKKLRLLLIYRLKMMLRWRAPEPT